ncbi:CPCC family cysteine-rich protein [Micromonospora profundi]|uniref:CPCC family cysteine-rich protein n=1 Tax=Micromonospora profundi TaxID=1420889 RepID=UPI003649006D
MVAARWTSSGWSRVIFCGWPADIQLWNAASVGEHVVPVGCPCCASRTGGGTCPVCFWTDDGQTDADADAVRGGANGDLSLTYARLNYAVYGASHPRYQDMVRPARPDERP